MRELSRAQEISRSIMKGFRSRIWSKFTKAISEYQLIEENDHIAVCISGGKDSMILAMCMQLLEKQGIFNDKRDSMCKKVGKKKRETNPAMKISSH